MILWTTQIDYEVLKSFIGKPNDLVVYVESTIPRWLRHIKAITQNQRYYIAIHLRKALTIPYKQRMELVEALVKDIQITGTSTSFTAMSDIIDMCDKDMLIKMLEQEVLHNEV